MEFKEIFKKLRTSSNLTQQQLSNNIGLSLNTIRSYETGRREPNSKAMVAIETYFNVSGAYLRGEEEMMWDDLEIMNEIDNGIIAQAKNVAITARKAPAQSEKMVSDIFIELKHTLDNEIENQSSDLTSLLQITYYHSNNFADACYRATPLEIEGGRIDKAFEDTINAYRNAMIEMKEKILEKKNSKSN